MISKNQTRVPVRNAVKPLSNAMPILSVSVVGWILGFGMLWTMLIALLIIFYRPFGKRKNPHYDNIENWKTHQ